MTQSAHIKAIDWALAQGFNMSVTDLCCDEGEWDLEHSTDRAKLIDACQATDIPNVYIYKLEGMDQLYLLTFSVIDEGIPDETINDWTIPRDDSQLWRIEAARNFELAVSA
jgi:hypothetical protein